MNQIIPTNQYNEQAYFYADASLNLGDLSKQQNATVLVNVDYRQITPAITLESFTFQIDIGSNPPLLITSANLNPTDNILTFILSLGLPGTTYNLTITVNYGVEQTRSDVLTVDIPVPEQCGSVGTIVNEGPFYNGDMTIYINSNTKYFVSPVQPVGAAIMDQWYNSESGVLYEFVTDGTNTWWQELGYLPSTPPVTFSTQKLAAIVPDGSTTSFNVTLSDGVTRPNILASTDLMVSVDGIMQEPDTDYTVNGSQVIFLTAPFASSKVYMVWMEHL